MLIKNQFLKKLVLKFRERKVSNNSKNKSVNNNNNYLYKILKKCNEENLNIFLNKLRIEEYNSNNVIFYQNSEADYFYIVLQGSVDIYQYKKNTINLNEKFENDKNKINNFLENQYKKNFLLKLNNDEKLFSKKKQNFKIVKIASVNKGEVFGEIGLLENTNRKATAITNNNFKDIPNIDINQNKVFNRIRKFSINKRKGNLNNIILAKMKKKDFNNFFNKVKFSFQNNNLKLSFFTEYLENFPFKNSLKDITYFFIKNKFNERDFIVKKGAQIKCLYLIYEGNISVIDKFNPYCKFNNNSIWGNSNYSKNLNWKVIARIVSKNYFIGLDELFSNNNSYNFTYKAMDSVICFKIEIKVF